MKKTIKFIGADGGQYTFKTCKNGMNNNQMWWIEPLPGMYVGRADAKQQIAAIRERCVIIEETSTCDIQRN